MQYPSPSTLLLSVVHLQDEQNVLEIQPAPPSNHDSVVDIASLYRDIKAADDEGVLDPTNSKKWGDDIAASVRCIPVLNSLEN